MSKKSKKSLIPQSDIQKIIDEAWMGLGDTSLLSFPDLFKPTDFEKENWGLNVIRVLRDPENLWYTAKIFLNIDLLPFQVVILQEMWTRPFPLIVMSRGAGKAAPLYSKILSSDGWKKMGDIKVGDKVYGRNGKLTNVKQIHPQGKKQICKITLLDGRVLECCEDHLWVVRKNKKEQVVSVKEMMNKGFCYPIRDTTSIKYHYQIPNCDPIEYEKKDLPIDPYIMGCLLGDGCMTTKTPKISTDDIFIVDTFKEKLPGFKIERDPTNNNYTIVDLEKDLTLEKRKNSKEFFARCRNRLTTKIEKLKINVSCKYKFIPDIYKYSTIEDRMEVLRGLMDSDGCANKSGSIEFTNTCERLVDDLIEVVRGLGMTCTKSEDRREGQPITYPCGTKGFREKYFRVYINTSKPIFKLPRKLERLKKEPTDREKYVSITNIEYTDKYTDMQCITVDSEDSTYIMDDTTVTHNSFLMSVYCMLKMIMTPPAKSGGAGCKIVVVGAAYRQARVLFEYMETMWNNSTRLRSLCVGRTQGPRRDIDRCTINIGENWCHCIPLGDGSKIRGLRANIVIADEKNSISPDIFNQVVQGFASVAANPTEKVKEFARNKKMKELGLHQETKDKVQEISGNQIILSGTCGYDFEHFAADWKHYKKIISSCGDIRKLEAVFPEGVPENFNWKNFCIVRIPCDAVPAGFMDQDILSRARATTHSGLYNMEYKAIFSKDSQGFFRSSTISRAVANEENTGKPEWPSYCPSPFDGLTRGNPNKKYAIAIDPASEADNFSVVVLELHKEHSRVVYVWTTNRKDHMKRKKIGLTDETDFYAFAARKIRELLLIFPCDRVAIDAQGGGIAVMEALHNKNNLKTGELQIWPVIDDDKESETDNEPGPHILEMIQFANYKWLSEANHGLRKDIEDKALIFPRFDSVTLELAMADDYRREQEFKSKYGNSMTIFDTLEDCVMEIEELKRELTSIILTKTGTGVNSRDRWDTPEIKGETGKKGRLRKDRYSSLIMANMIARKMRVELTPLQYDAIGGAISEISSSSEVGDPYGNAPEWLRDTASSFYNEI